tara:strand:+ start:829 stop:1830 length:1002 start_codon:yes stop_codon:yes gene_type:complete
MKMHKYYIIIIILLYGCNNPTSSDIPNESPNEDLIQYESNISAINSGLHIEHVNIDWASYTKSGFIEYRLSDQNNENIITLSDITESNYKIDIPISDFQKIYLNVETESNAIQDSIEIFTRGVKPITNFSAIANGNGSTELTWDSSNEIDSIFANYTIYRLNSLDYNQFNNLENCNCVIAELINQNEISYIDNGGFTEGSEYFYIIRTNTIQGYNRKSIIKSNLSSIDYSCSPTISEYPIPNASQSEHNKITLNWNHNLDETEFYELQIWRSASSDTNPLNGILLTTIIDYNKTDFSDYYNIGDGTAWFYKIKLVDIHGNEDISDTILGNSHP